MEELPKLWQQDRDKREAHFNLIRTTFLNRCKSENLVYHGVSGQELIRRVPHVLRVLVIADEAYRLERAKFRLGLDTEMAHERIVKSDRRISKWTRYMYGFDWKDPALYDLVLHIGRIGVKRAVETISMIIGGGEFDPTEESRQLFTDELLASRVWAELTNNEATIDANLETTARRGVVTVTGTARSKRVHDAIVGVARSVKGVAGVINEANIGTIWRS